MQIAFERELNVGNDLQKPTSDTTLYWLNQAVLKFVKTRYNGTNAKTLAFEQSQKRIDDLRTLVSTTNFTEGGKDIRSIPDENKYLIELPDDYLFQVGTRVGILPKLNLRNPYKNCWKTDSDGDLVVKYTDAIEVTHDTVDRELENSLSERHLHYCSAKPLKLVQGNNIIFFADDYYYITEVIVEYIRMPNAITLNQAFDNYTELPEHTHSEIVKMAVQMYLESTADQRYTSYSNEVNTME